MAKPTDLVRVVSANANYSTLTARTARNNTPTKVSPPLAYYREGHKPAEGTPAQYQNFLENVWSKYILWVSQGSSQPTASAHIMETKSDGSTHMRFADVGVTNVSRSGDSIFNVAGDPATAYHTCRIRDFGNTSNTFGTLINAANRGALEASCEQVGATHGLTGHYPAILARVAGDKAVVALGKASGATSTTFRAARGLFASYTQKNTDEVGLHIEGHARGALARLYRAADTVNPNQPIFDVVADGNVQPAMRVEGKNTGTAIPVNTSEVPLIEVRNHQVDGDSNTRCVMRLYGEQSYGLQSDASPPDRSLGVGYAGAFRMAYGRNGTVNSNATALAAIGVNGPTKSSSIRAFRQSRQLSHLTSPQTITLPNNYTAGEVRIADDAFFQLSFANNGLNVDPVSDRLGLYCTDIASEGRKELVIGRTGNANTARERVFTTTKAGIHWLLFRGDLTQNAQGSTNFILADLDTRRSNLGPTAPRRVPGSTNLLVRVGFTILKTTTQNTELTFNLRDGNNNRNYGNFSGKARPVRDVPMSMILAKYITVESIREMTFQVRCQESPIGNAILFSDIWIEVISL